MRQQPVFFSSLPFLLLIIVVPCSFLGCGSRSETEVEPASSSSPTPVKEAVSPQPTATPTIDQTVIAQLPGDVITYGRLRRYIDARKAHLMSQMAGRDDLQPYLVGQLEKKTKEVIEWWLLLEEAQRIGLEATPSEMEALLAQAKSLYRTEEHFKDYLRGLDGMGAGLDVLLTNHILITKMDRRRREEILEKITPETKQAWYEQHVETFSPPALSDVRRVCLLYADKRTPDDASQELRKLLTQVQKQFKAVRDVTGRIEIMKQFAFQHSETIDGKYNRGLHTVYHVPEAWPSIGKEYSDTILHTPVGVLSDIVPIPSGYSFFYVIRQHPKVVYPLDHPVTQRQLPHLMLQEELERWRDRKWKEHQIEYYPDRLEACVDKDLDIAMRAAAEARATRTTQATPGSIGNSTFRPESAATPRRL